MTFFSLVRFTCWAVGHTGRFPCHGYRGGVVGPCGWSAELDLAFYLAFDWVDWTGRQLNFNESRMADWSASVSVWLLPRISNAGGIRWT